MSCIVAHRCGSDPELLWLCLRRSAGAQIRPLVWGPPYAVGGAQKKKKKKKKEEEEKAKKVSILVHSYNELLY